MPDNSRMGCPFLVSAGPRGDVCDAEFIDALTPAQLRSVVSASGGAPSGVLRSRGTSMFPAIRPGDILHLSRVSANDIEVGAIIVFNRSHELYAHRVHKKIVSPEGCRFFTRPDNPGILTEGPIVEDAVLGVVDYITRKNHRIVPGRIPARMMTRLLCLPFLLIYNAKKPLVKAMHIMLRYIQYAGWYRSLMRRCFYASLRERLEFRVLVPVSSGIDSLFYRPMRIVEALREYSSDEVVKWACYALLDGKIVAGLTFFRRPSPCPLAGWWVRKTDVTPLYRGLGLEVELLEQMTRFFEAISIHEIRIGILRRDRQERKRWESAGFRYSATVKEWLVLLRGTRLT